MDREGFRNRLKQYKQAREENPGLKYWEWKDIPKYDEGTDGIRDNTYVAPIEKEQVFIPATGSTKLKQDVQRDLTRNGQIKSGAVDIVSPEFDLLTLGRGIFTNNLLPKAKIGDLPINDNTYYRMITDQWYGKSKKLGAINDIINSKSVRTKNSVFASPMFSKGKPYYNPDDYRDSYYIISNNKKGLKWSTVDALGNPNNNPQGVAFTPLYNGISNSAPKDYFDIYKYLGNGKYQQILLNSKVAPITGLNLIGENVDRYADGGEVIGPPTYEQWDADMNQYNPTILDNASMYWSIEAAKKALHNEAMKLPGYAERWTEYYRSLPKNDPDINEFVDELWANENPNNVGLKNGKYYPHKSPEGGKPTIGPGFKIGSGSHRITKKQAERGMTKARLNQEARYIGKQHLNAVDQFINYGQTTNPADTVSPQIKMGLMDLRHQVGPLNEWGNLRQAVLNGDLEGIRKESTVTWNDNGKTKVDKRRKKIRDEKYFYYE